MFPFVRFSGTTDSLIIEKFLFLAHQVTYVCVNRGMTAVSCVIAVAERLAVCCWCTLSLRTRTCIMCDILLFFSALTPPQRQVQPRHGADEVHHGAGGRRARRRQAQS